MPAGWPSNLHQLYMRGMHPLGVECLGCRRRALVPAERFGACKGDMREIDTDLRLVCSGCGARDWHTVVFDNREEAETWREGRPRYIAGDGRQADILGRPPSSADDGLLYDSSDKTFHFVNVATGAIARRVCRHAALRRLGPFRMPDSG